MRSGAAIGQGGESPAVPHINDHNEKTDTGEDRKG